MNAATTSTLFDRLGTQVRMRRLATYDLFHPELPARLDVITAATAEQLGAPVSMVTIVLDSAQMVLSCQGSVGAAVDLVGTPAEWALCSYAVLSGNTYVVPDSTTDPLHADNPMLAMVGLRSYAGVPLADGSGQVLGTHCVLDGVPRDLSTDELAVLADGAERTMRVLAEFRLGD